MIIAAFNTQIINVTAQTNWIFVTVHDRAGSVGLGEASLNGMEPIVRECVRMQGGPLIGLSPDDALASLEILPRSPAGLAWNAATSAIEQALFDLIAQARGVPIHRVFGEPARDRVTVYANINRATVDRSPQGCADSARTAIAQGFDAVKIAPFDNVTPRICGTDAGRAAIARGIARVGAIRHAVGAAVDVMVDCHWRFDAPTATTVLLELAKLGVRWYECPVSEAPLWWPVLKRLRGLANERGMQLAGAETQIGLASFRPMFEKGLFDVVMPDIKYAGGYREMLRIAAQAEKFRTACSPHNPSGPVATFASLHATATTGALDRLEYQLGESVLYFEVVHGVGPRFDQGHFSIPDKPGLGLQLNQDVIAAHPYAPVPVTPDPRLG